MTPDPTPDAPGLPHTDFCADHEGTEKLYTADQMREMYQRGYSHGVSDIKSSPRYDASTETQAAPSAPAEGGEDALHVAICQAVALMNMEPMTTTGLLQAHDILRKAIS